MIKWILRLVFFGIIGLASYVAYDYFNAGYHTRPEMAEGSFSLSYKSGLRAIMIGFPDNRKTRSYLGFPQEVPDYMEDAWSTCRAPNGQEAPDVANFLKERDIPGERFEAVCEITADDDVVLRGLISSVPKL